MLWLLGRPPRLTARGDLRGRQGDLLVAADLAVVSRRQARVTDHLDR